MDDARKEAFIKWMLSPDSGYRITENNLRNRCIRELKEIENAERAELDQICIEQGGLENLWNRYKYTQEMAKAAWNKLEKTGETPKTTPMNMHPALLLRNLARYRSRLNQYKQFCEAHPPK